IKAVHAFLNVPTIISTGLHDVDLLVEFLTSIGNNYVPFRIKTEAIRIPEPVSIYFIKAVAPDERVVRRNLVNARCVHIDAKDASKQVLCNVLTVAALHVSNVVVVAASAITHRNIEITVR